MRDAWIKAAAVVASTRELYRKLTSAQRAALILAAGVVMTSLSIVAHAMVGPDPSGEGEGAGAASGSSQARDKAGRPTLEPVERSSGFFGIETLGAKEWRRLEANRVMLEHALVGGKVEAATVLYSPAKPARYVFEKGREASAAVMLYLVPDEDRLEHEEANGLRDMVVHALSLQPERVFLRDDRGNTHAASGSQGGNLSHHEGEEALRREIRDAIMGYYSKLYALSEFLVTVTVYFSMEETVIEKTDYDPDRKVRRKTRETVTRKQLVDTPAKGGIGAFKKQDPAAGNSIESEFEEEMEVSSTKTKTSLPRGVPCSVSANILVDLQAVLRNQALEPDPTWDGPRSGAGDAEWLLAACRSRQEAAILNLLRPYPDPSVKVEFQPFVKPDSIVPQPAVVTVTASPVGEAVAFPPWLLLTFLGTGLVALCVLLLVGGRARRKWQSRGMQGLPILTPAGSSGMGLSVGEALNEARAPGRVPSLRRGFSDDILRTVDDTSSRVQERPEVAAAVLRFWLRQDREEAQVGASRS